MCKKFYQIHQNDKMGLPYEGVIARVGVLRR